MAGETSPSSEGWTEGWKQGRSERRTELYTDLNSGSSAVVFVQVTVSVLVVLGNSLVLVAIRRSKSLKRVTYLFLGHLAVADVLFGMGIFIRSCLVMTDSLNKYPCLINYCFIIASASSSLTGTLFLSVDSYLSVKYFYKQILVPRLGWYMIVGCWLFWVSFALLSVVLAAYNPIENSSCTFGGGYYERWYVITLPTYYFIVLTLVLYYQLHTVVFMRRHLRQLTPQTDQHFTTGGTFQLHLSNPPQRRRLKQLINLAKLIGTVLVAFFVCSTPLMTGLYFVAMCEENCPQATRVTGSLASLLVVNSLMNVFIYALKSPEFRDGFRKALRPCRTLVNWFGCTE